MMENNDTPKAYNDFQIVKRHFFAMRNGVIADTLRKGGSKFRIIFGLNLPQIAEIAPQVPNTAGFARRMWENDSTRESMLLAPMLYPKDEFSREEAEKWIAGVPECEVADILCHRLLRFKDYAPELAKAIVESEDAAMMERYTALRLFFNLVSKYPAEAKAAAMNPLNARYPLTASIARMLADEADFILEGV